MATDYNTRAAKGQAFNLAVHEAVARGKENDPKFIYKRYVFYYTLGDTVQGSDLDMVQEVINNKDFDKVMKQLSEAMK